MLSWRHVAGDLNTSRELGLISPDVFVQIEELIIKHTVFSFKIGEPHRWWAA